MNGSAKEYLTYAEAKKYCVSCGLFYSHAYVILKEIPYVLLDGRRKRGYAPEDVKSRVEEAVRNREDLPEAPEGYAFRRELYGKFPEVKPQKVDIACNRCPERIRIGKLYAYKISWIGSRLENRNGLLKMNKPVNRIDLPRVGFENAVKHPHRWFPAAAFTGRAWSKADIRKFNAENPIVPKSAEIFYSAFIARRFDDCRVFSEGRGKRLD